MCLVPKEYDDRVIRELVQVENLPWHLTNASALTSSLSFATASRLFSASRHLHHDNGPNKRRPINYKRNHGQLPRVHLRHGARQGQLLLLLQDWRLPSRRPLLAQTRQAVVQPDDPAPEPVPEPGLRPEEQDEPAANADAFRRLLRGHLVRAVPVRTRGGASSMRQ
jgi:hypothetical protein